ncbi:putative alpha-1,6-mannosyl-glycoprotein beta-1,2-N-acetylglucosaminyltransferase [Corchorus olitorius]|uniref:Alpha-1,6-mannosyl-glycoprotein beta-1,2-N-acetylglucosaminyltransferase n=1 Tax=Corchorus olitorius TaxID=93759 RepID=A0A1R3I380_9ROSI|nr:putative alpha-1,6-mannosyl-glycoprotein beta-1,2-N-acetylglucosaminyltransferase [Corchorus olitorius]
MAPSSSNEVPSVAKKYLKLDPEAKNSTKHGSKLATSSAVKL